MAVKRYFDTMIEIVSEKIDIVQVLESIKDCSAGGIDMFIGTTRNYSNGKKVLSLEYEVYVPMAIKKMKEIEEIVRKRWEICKISMIHRIGKVEVGEVSVVIAVSSTHRKEAFESCRFTIDILKKEVPIWKKEVFENGEIWVEN